MSEIDIRGLINEVKDLCVEHGRVLDEGDSVSANNLHKKISNIFNEIIANGLVSELMELLKNDDENVKLWAASYLLSIEEKLAISVLSQVEKSDRLIGLEATIIKDMWNKGMLNL